MGRVADRSVAAKDGILLVDAGPRPTMEAR